MCQSKEKGGKRCSARAKKNYQRAWNEYLKGEELTSTLDLNHPEIYMGAVAISLRKTAAEYYFCTGGDAKVSEDLRSAEAQGQILLAEVLRRAIGDAQGGADREMDITKAIQEALKARKAGH